MCQEAELALKKMFSLSALLKAELKLLGGGYVRHLKESLRRAETAAHSLPSTAFGSVWVPHWLVTQTTSVPAQGKPTAAPCELTSRFLFHHWWMISLSNKYNFWITQYFVKLGAISSQVVVCLQEQMVYKNDCTGRVIEGDFLSPYKLCTVKYIVYFLQKSISPPEYVPQGPDKKFKL